MSSAAGCRGLGRRWAMRSRWHGGVVSRGIIRVCVLWYVGSVLTSAHLSHDVPAACSHVRRFTKALFKRRAGACPGPTTLHSTCACEAEQGCEIGAAATRSTSSA